jgi:predicted RNase H-like nuclease (RuvC/YqgF family)
MEFLPTEKLLNEARATLDRLRRKHADALARQTVIAHDRRKIGFRAHTGDAKARKELDSLGTESVLLQGEIDSLSAAIEEGTARVAQAEAEVRAAIARATALRARDELIPAFRQVAAEVSRALDQLGEGLAKYLEVANELGVTVGGTSRAVASANLKQSLNAKLFAIDRLNNAPLPRAASMIPSVAELTERLIENVTGRIDQTLSGEPDPVDADQEEAA